MRRIPKNNTVNYSGLNNKTSTILFVSAVFRSEKLQASAKLEVILHQVCRREQNDIVNIKNTDLKNVLYLLLSLAEGKLEKQTKI